MELILYKCESCGHEGKTKKIRLASDGFFIQSNEIEGDFDFCNSACLIKWLQNKIKEFDIE